MARFSKILPSLLALLAVGLTTLAIVLSELERADDSLRQEVEDIETDCDNNLSLLLHSDAGAFADAFMQTNVVTSAGVKRLSQILEIDEVNLVSTNGDILVTTAVGVTAGDRFFADEARQGVYRDLLSGRRTTVRQRFRPSTACPDLLMKYFAMSLPNGNFLQIGYSWETFEREFPRYIVPLLECRTVGRTGFCVIVDDTGRVIGDIPGHPEALRRPASEIGLTPRNLAEPADKIFRARLFGRRCRCMFYKDTLANLRVIAVFPVADALVPAVGLSLAVALVILAAFVVFRLVLRKFRRQQAKIDALRAAEEERRAADLVMARAVQRAELRTDGTHGDGYRLRALMDAAREVGGDFYDYYELPDGRLVLTIADVSGKGVPAALFMMKARTTLKSCLFEKPSLAEAVAEANVRLSLHNPAELFVTVWVGVWEKASGRLEYVSGGHNPPLVKRRDGAVEWVQGPRCAALGVFEMARYRAAELKLETGDGLFLYTDGVTEAMNCAGELFGDARLEAAIRSSLYPLVPAVIEAVGEFTTGAEQSDDITMLELHVETEIQKEKK